MEKGVNEEVKENEVMVLQMDTVAFLHAEYGIVPLRDGILLAQHAKLKKTAYWVFKKTAEVEKAITEWNSQARERTKVINGFRDKQLLYRSRKAELERKA